MIIKKALPLLFYLALSPLFFYSQDQKKVDSLNLLVNSSIDTSKVNGFNGFGILYIQTKPEEAKTYTDKALSLSQKINFKKGAADAYVVLGGYHFFGGRFDTALYYNSKALDFYTTTKIYKKISSLYQNRANILRRAGRLQESKETFLNAYNYNRRLKDTLQMAHNLANIADISSNLGKMDDAISNHIAAQKLYKAVGNDWGIIVCLNNIASVYRFQKLFKKAIDNYTKVLEYCQKIKRDDGIITGLDNIGATYLEMGDIPNGEKYLLQSYEHLNKQENQEGRDLITVHLATLYHFKSDYVNAEKFYLESEKLYTAANNAQGLTSVYTNLGTLYQEQGKYKQSIDMLLKTEELCNMLGVKPELKDVYVNLGLAYSKMGNYAKAYEYATKCSMLKDSLYMDKTNEVIGEMEAKYQNDKNQKELELKNTQLDKKESEIKAQNLQKMAFAGGAGALLILGLVLYRGNAVKKRANTLLIIQKQEITHQKALIEEKNKDITDSIQYAKRLQEAVLPEAETLSNYFPEAFILFKPKDIVSGDFYWFEQAGDKTIFVVGDCTGHGVPGAFMSILGHNLLNQIVMEYGVTSPAEILRMLDKQVSGALNKRGNSKEYNDGMDIAICVLDKQKKTLAFAGANRPLVIKRGKELIELKQNKFAIGGIQDDTCKLFTQHEIEVQSNDILYIFSDGYYDQFGGPKGKKFKYKQLMDSFLSLETKSLAEQKLALEESLEKWRGNLEQVDDVCIIGVRI